MKALFVTFCMMGMLAMSHASPSMTAESLTVKARYENQLKIQAADADGVVFQNRIGQIDNFAVIPTNDLPQIKGTGIPVDFTQILMKGYTYSHQAGLPKLPVKVELIELPQGAVPRIQVTRAEYKDINLSEAGYPAPLFPAQPPMSKSAKETPAFQYDAYTMQPTPLWAITACFPAMTIRIWHRWKSWARCAAPAWAGLP